MHEKNGRKLDRKAQEAIRLMAVERVREGELPSDVIASYGMNRTTIHKWLNRTKGKGAGLRKLKSRKGAGRPRSLTDKQERQAFRWINGKNPMQYAKRMGTARRPLKAGEKLSVKVDSQLNGIRNNPRLVRSFFGHPSVA